MSPFIKIIPAHGREARIHEAMYETAESHCFAQFQQPPKAVLDVRLLIGSPELG